MTVKPVNQPRFVSVGLTCRSAQLWAALPPRLTQAARGRGGFTLIEFIAVLAIISILALILTEVVIKRVDFAAYNAEQANLANFANALTLQALRNGQIPSEANWATAVGNWSSYSLASVLTNPRNNTRAYLIDSSSWLTSAGYIQTAAGTNVPGNARVMFVSSIGAALPAAWTNNTLNASEFNNLWETNFTVDSDFIVQRLNLQPLFHRVILNAIDTNNFGGFTVQGDPTASFNQVTTNFDAWFLQGTVISLYDTNYSSINLESKVVVQGDASYVFENCAWRGQLSGWGTNGPASPYSTPVTAAADAFTSLATKFTARGTQDKSPQILAGFYAFMMDYNAWCQESFATNDYVWNALTNDATRIKTIIP